MSPSVEQQQQQVVTIPQAAYLVFPDKYEMSGPIVEWCERNGIDPSRVPASSDALEVEPGPDGQLLAHVWFIVCDDDLPFRPPAGTRVRGGSEELQYLRVVPVDSRPPVSQEWAALFGDATHKDAVVSSPSANPAPNKI